MVKVSMPEILQEVEKLDIHVGCVITYPDEFHVLNKNNFVCRALDNRMGNRDLIL
jgi:putative aminopeptidase FrvX